MSYTAKVVKNVDAQYDFEVETDLIPRVGDFIINRHAVSGKRYKVLSVTHINTDDMDINHVQTLVELEFIEELSFIIENKDYKTIKS